MDDLKCFYLIYTSGYETTISAKDEADAIYQIGNGLPAYSTELSGDAKFEYYLLTWKDGISMTIVAPSIMAAVYKSGKGTPLTTEILEKKEEKEKPDLKEFEFHKKTIRMVNSIIEWWETIGKFVYFTGVVGGEPEFVKIAKDIAVDGCAFDYDELIKKLKELGYEERDNHERTREDGSNKIN